MELNSIMSTDSASPNISARLIDFLTTQCIKLLPHPPYSPHLIPRICFCYLQSK